MKKLTSPDYGWRVVKDLARYAATTKAKDPWGHGKQAAKDFKKEMTRLMLIEQSQRCAYCGCRLFEKKPHRDHIAPKEKYKCWMFWPENLALACFACNTDLKKEFDPVVKVGKTYRSTTFSFVHPFLDEPELHIEYAAAGLSVLISPVDDSLKGKKTIELFDLKSPERTKQRAKDALFDDDLAHLNGKFLTLFQNAAAEIFTQRFVSKVSP